MRSADSWEVEGSVEREFIWFDSLVIEGAQIRRRSVMASTPVQVVASSRNLFQCL
jgi:hypothetical protein